MVKLVNKLSDNHSLTGEHERLVKRVDIDRMIIIHEVAHLCISRVPIFDHVHLSPIAQNRTMLHGRERFGHHDMRGGSLKTTGQRKSLPTFLDETVATMRAGGEDINRAIASG